MDFSVMIRVIGCFFAVPAFSALLGLPKKQLLNAGFVGAVGGAVYLFAGYLGAGEVGASFCSAFAAALLGHIFARMLKMPVTILLISGIVPIVPGAGMYQIVWNIIQRNEEMTHFYLVQTIEIAGVIALAIFIVDTIFRSLEKGDKWKK